MSWGQRARTHRRAFPSMAFALGATAVLWQLPQRPRQHRDWNAWVGCFEKTTARNGRPLRAALQYERRQSHRLVLRRMRALWSPELPHWRYQLNAKGRFLPDGRPAVVVHGHLWRSAPPPQAVARCVLLRLARAWRPTAAHRLHPKISDALWWPCAGHRSPVYEAQLRCRSGRARATLFGRLRRCHPRIAPLPLLL